MLSCFFGIFFKTNRLDEILKFSGILKSKFELRSTFLVSKFMVSQIIQKPEKFERFQLVGIDNFKVLRVRLQFHSLGQ